MNIEPIINTYSNWEDLPKLSCIVIDNNKKTVESNIEYINESAKYILWQLTIHKANNCISWLNAILEIEPDFCLLDYNMPSWEELYKWNKIENWTQIIDVLNEVKSKTKVILVTGYPNKFDVNMITNPNFMWVIIKSAEPELIVKKITNLIDQSIKFLEYEKNNNDEHYEHHESEIFQSFLVLIKNECKRIMTDIEDIIVSKFEYYRNISDSEIIKSN